MVDLRDGWHLERITERGWERVRQVVLLSPPSQHVYVWDGGTSHVNYRLGVDGTLIDFRSGEISIGIDVVVPGENRGGSGGGGYGGHYGR